MKPVEFHPASQAESSNAFDWYWVRNQVAALDFADELKAALARLHRTPEASPPYLHGTRRMLLNRFPFYVVFRERLHDIQVIAIAHA
jgi:plasmid stabilization system protein ParE